MPSTEETSFEILIDNYKKISATQPKIQALEEVKRHHDQLIHTLDLGQSFWVIFDFTNFSYRYVSPSFKDISGRSNEFLLEKGFPGYMELVEPEESGLLEKSWGVLTEHVKTLPLEQLQKCDYCCDWHLRHKDGHSVHVLQQSVLLKTNEEGRLVYELIKCTDISHWQKKTPISIILTTPDPQYKLIYYPGEDIKIVGEPFTAAERRVLVLLAQGERSRSIADTLSISRHTVDTHRRKMLRKTQSANTQELIRFGYLSGSL